jgi:LacI family transcriptional regulator
VVVFQAVFASSSTSVAVVRQDDVGGGRLLGEHLRSKREIRSITFLRMALDWCAVEQRELGLRGAIAEAGNHIAVETVIAPSERFDDVYETVKVALPKRLPSAIVAATDSMAVAALKACEALRIAVPGDVLITGFNGFDVWRYTSPTLTTVRSPAYEMGRFAGELLVRRLEAGAFSRRRMVFPVSLQVGESS